MIRRTLTTLAVVAVAAGSIALTAGPASAACRDQTKPGTFKGTGCFTVQTMQPDRRAQGRA